MNAIAWLESESVYNDVSVQHVIHNKKEVPR